MASGLTMRHVGYLCNLSKIGNHWLVLSWREKHNPPLSRNSEFADWSNSSRKFPNSMR